VAQTLTRFQTPVSDRTGALYDAKACGSERDDGMWEGWIEFQDRRARAVLRTQRETTQPNLKDLTYWATGLTAVYLEGALDRILNPPQPRPPEYVPPPAFNGPARSVPPRRKTGEAILNPFSVYEKSPDLLAQELTALRGWHLRQIIREYDLARESDATLEALNERELGSLILERVRQLHA
jgi:hypothetical protein